MITRRLLIAGALGAPVGALAAAARADAARIILSEPAVQTYGPVMAFGDSTSSCFMRDLIRQLKDQQLGPYVFDIQPARSLVRSNPRFPSVLQGLSQARARGFDPAAYVVAAGINDTWYFGRRPDRARSMIDTLLDTIGGDRHVGMLTIYSRKRGSYYYQLNEAMFAAQARWPRLRVFDWAALARRHPEWHRADGVHFTLGGSVQRDKYVTTAMVAMAQIARTASTTTTTTTTTTIGTTTTATTPPGSSSTAPQRPLGLF